MNFLFVSIPTDLPQEMRAPGNAIIGNTPNRSIIHNVANNTFKPCVLEIVFTLAINRCVHVIDVKRVVSIILFISPEATELDLENRFFPQIRFGQMTKFTRNRKEKKIMPRQLPSSMLLTLSFV